MEISIDGNQRDFQHRGNGRKSLEICDHQTCNQEVMGSNPIALTNEISVLATTQKSRQFTADL